MNLLVGSALFTALTVRPVLKHCLKASQRLFYFPVPYLVLFNSSNQYGPGLNSCVDRLGNMLRDGSDRSRDPTGRLQSAGGDPKFQRHSAGVFTWHFAALESRPVPRVDYWEHSSAKPILQSSHRISTIDTQSRCSVNKMKQQNVFWAPLKILVVPFFFVFASCNSSFVAPVTR